MRNPNWHRDELILALDLYFSVDTGKTPPQSEIAELSSILNALPIFTERPDAEKFRNVNGVGLKLSNFQAVDPAYTGKGMERGGKLDREVFNEFFERRSELRQVATTIKKAIADPVTAAKLYQIRDEEDSDFITAQEGEVLYRLHKLRERNRKITEKKKRTELKKHGKLACEVCNFVFNERYGQLGDGFIECHHRTPLAKLDFGSKTRLEDLALVCSNCHRMLHKRTEVGIEQLKASLK